MLRGSGLLLCTCLALGAQTSDHAALQFTGSPLVLPYTCSDEDLDWAGLSCGDDPCPIYLELSHAAGAGKTIMVTGDLHAPAATMYSVLLRSDDAGRTWNEPFARVRGAVLDRVQMYDSQTAWISGGITQPLALDPFFLTTQNGGKNWDRVPLFEEGTPGSIVQFTFDTRDHGTAMVDHGGGERRYEVYETLNSGRDWSLHQMGDEPPKVKSLEDSEWRIHPETKLFRLQHLEDGRWAPFAAFALNVAKCQEKPPAPAKPDDAAPAHEGY